MKGRLFRTSKRVSAVVLSAAMAFTGTAAMVPSQYVFAETAEAAVQKESTFDFTQLKESSRTGSWGTTRQVSDEGVLTLSFSGQYAEQRFDLPDELNGALISQVSVDLVSGDASTFTIKLLDGADEADVAYGSTSIRNKNEVSFDGIGLMTTAEEASDYEIAGITFVYTEGNGQTTEKPTSYSIAENFDDYSKASEVKGYTFGNPTLELTEAGKDGQGLLVTDRTQNYFSYALNLSKFAGNTIEVTADICAVDAAEEDENTFSATLKTTKSGEDDNYSQVASVDAVGAEFVTLSGTYEVPAGCDTYDIYFETAEGVSYVIDNISIAVVGEYVEPGKKETVDSSEYESLKELYTDDFRMGVACEAISHWNNSLSEIGNPEKEALMLKEFNSITFGNELKPDYNMDYNSPEATETFLPFGANRAAIEMLDWAKENGMPVRGHTLVWHSQCPDAVFCKNYKPVYLNGGSVLDPSCLVDAETMKLRMESYIYNVMEYMYKNGYADVIYAWDVVNEAIEPGTNQYNMRNSYWYQTIGKDFIFDAFKYTRAAVNKYSVEYADLYDGEVISPKLFYNDYNEFQASKRDAIIKAVTPIKEAGYIDGIGMQAHLSDTTDIDTFMTAVQMYNDVVGEVQLTELDVTQTSSGSNAEYYQGMFYYKLFKALLDAKASGVNLTAVTIWGLTDDNSWKKESLPLIFNGDLSKKLAFDGIVRAKTGEAMPEPTYEAPDFKDGIFTFDEEDATAASLGFTSRGDGNIEIQSDDTYTGKGAILDTGRTASWNGTSFDVSRFVGQTISVSAWVKSEDPVIKISADIDGSWPNIASVASEGEWVQLMGIYTIPAELTALKLYFETEGTADILIDNVEVKLVGLDEGFEGASNIASPRGVGHMPVVTTTKDVVRTGDKALKVTRAAKEATVKFDISKYVGNTVDVIAYVKTADEKILLGLDGDTPVTYAEVESVDGEFTEVKATVAIPNTMTSANIFVETSGTADFYVDDFSVRIADVMDDVENGNNFTTRWGGAGSIELVEEDGNHVAKLTDRTETYMGAVYDVSAYLGMAVEISFDVKTDDTVVKLSGDIDQVWPNYLTAEVTPGEYTNVACTTVLPNDLSALKVYIETNGKSDIYVDNFCIKRIPAGKQYKVAFQTNKDELTIDSIVATEGSLLATVAELTTEDETSNGWYTDEACTNKWNFTADRVAADMTLYAGWGEVSDDPVIDEPGDDPVIDEPGDDPVIDEPGDDPVIDEPDKPEKPEKPCKPVKVEKVIKEIQKAVVKVVKDIVKCIKNLFKFK